MRTFFLFKTVIFRLLAKWRVIIIHQWENDEQLSWQVCQKNPLYWVTVNLQRNFTDVKEIFTEDVLDLNIFHGGSFILDKWCKKRHLSKKAHSDAPIWGTVPKVCPNSMPFQEIYHDIVCMF